MRANLDKRDQDNMIYKKASFLHPSTKSLQFLPKDDIQEVLEEVKEEMRLLQKKDQDRSNDEPSTSKPNEPPTSEPNNPSTSLQKEEVPKTFIYF